jgi:hypothetical protein
MVQGFIVDHHVGGKRLVSSCVEGAPEKSFWHSANVPGEKGAFRGASTDVQSADSWNPMRG